MRKSIGYQAIKDKAMRFLKDRLHSSGELRKKLAIRGYPGDLIDKLVKELVEIGYLHDETFAKNYLDSLIRFKTFGFYGLKAKLLQRGIASNEAEELLKERLSLEDEMAIALRIVQKEKQTDKVKLAQKLNRKGFRAQVIRQVFSLSK